MPSDLKTVDEDDPVLAMAGVGAEIWEGVDPDDYVRALRAGWDPKASLDRCPL